MSDRIGTVLPIEPHYRPLMEIKLRKVLLASAVVVLAACSEATSPSHKIAELNPSAILISDAGTVVVTEADIARQPESSPVPTDNWVFFYRTVASTGTFLIGPDAPPLGVGSFEMSTPASGDKGWLFNYDHVGAELADVDAISYSTYRSAGSLQQVAALNLQVDVNGAAPGGFTTLVFEPVYNTGQGAVVNDEWQDWDAYSVGSAVWWSSNAIPSAPNRDTFVSWATIVAANPDAIIVGGIGVNQGSGNPALTTAVDALTFGYSGNSIAYDFEPFATATSKASCMNGGWMNVKRADGSSFNNQGDCVSYLNTGR